jgi:hypothetical protein
MSRWPLPLAGVGVVALLVAASGRQRQESATAGELLLEPNMHHLGDDKTPEWKEAPADPEKPPLEVKFESSVGNDKEWVLELTSHDVDTEWTLELNGKKFGTLKKVKNVELLPSWHVVPAGLVVAGANVLRVIASDPREDVTVGRMKLVERPFREVAKLGRIDVRVTDAATKQPIPARVTVADASGKLVELFYAEARTTAVRPGIAYTSNGVAAIEVPQGHVQVWASRGMEWSAAKSELDVVAGSTQSLELTIAREVDTTGWIAADTHMHTLTFSGHGDSSVEERMVTIAGEGIELAIATDHNHQTDYRPYQQKLDLNPYFTPVIGNEVTTDNGHMNAFPLPPGKDVPAYKELDWSRLVEGIRAKGAKVVILNHPRWPDAGRDPLTIFGFDVASGERRAQPQKFTFDCFELVNSDAPTQPWDVVLPCWYALLNRGERFTGVGASDSHHVGVILGQGRTYVPSRSDDPTKIDVDDACRQFKEGRVSVSLGMFATIDVDGHGMGDSVVVPASSPAASSNSSPSSSPCLVDAVVRVRHPSWVTPEKLDLIVDGAVAASAPLTTFEQKDGVTWKERRVRVPLPSHDCWLVAVATGAKVTAPFWAMTQPRAVAVTNPIFLDHDGVAGWSSPRATAQTKLASVGVSNGTSSSTAALADLVARELPRVDDGVAIQMLELARDALRADAQQRLEGLAGSAGSAGSDRPALKAWAQAQGRPR